MALAFRAASVGNQAGTTATSQVITRPTGTTTDDTVYFQISVAAVISAPVCAGWALTLTTNATGPVSTITGYRTVRAGDTNPTVTWTTAGKVSYVAITLDSTTTGQVPAHVGYATPTNTATSATTHTPNTFAAGSLSGTSVLLTAPRVTATGATAVTNLPPTNWTEPANGDTSTATGTTTATRQISAHVCYRLTDTGTVTPAAVTHSLASVAIINHAFAVESTATAGLTSDFAAGLPAFFTTTFGGAAVSGGQLSTPTVGSYSGAKTDYRYSLTGSSVYAEVVTASGMSGSRQNSIRVELDANNAVEMIMDGGTFKGRSIVAGANTEATLPTYDPVAHRWWRIRESGGTAFFDTSYEGTVWTQQGSVTHGLGTIAPASLGLQAGYWGTETAPPDAVYDNVNITPAQSFTRTVTDAIQTHDGGGIDTHRLSRTITDSVPTRDPGYAPLGIAPLGIAPLGGGSRVQNPAAAPPAATLTDDFTAQNTATWDFLNGAAVSGGRLVLTPRPDYGDAAVTDVPYSLTGSSVYAEAVSPPNVGNGSTEMFLQVQQAATNNDYALSFDITGGSLLAKYIVAGAQTTQATLTYSNTTHRWLRIREAGGTVFWDTSLDGSTWTNRASMPAPIEMSPLYVQLGSGYWGTEPTPGTAVWDNVNTTGAGGGTAYSQTITDAAGVADSLTRASTAAQTVTDAAGAVDTAAGVQTASRPTTDVAGAADTLAQVATAARPTTDVAGAADTAAAVQTASRPTTDVAGAVDTLAQASAAAQAVTDVAGAVDAISQSSATNVTQTITDAAGAADSTSQASTAAQTFTDAAGASDATATSTSRTLTDAAGTADTPAQVLTAAQTATDAAGAADATAQAASYAPSLTDPAGAADGTTQVAPSARAITDAAGAVDSLAAATSRPLTDVAGVADTTSQASTAAQTVTDTAGAADSVSTNFTSPSISTLTDTFATQDTAKWTFGANAVVSGGQLVCALNNLYDGEITAKTRYDLTGSAASVQLVQAPNVGNGSTEAFLILDCGDGTGNVDSILADVTNGLVLCETRVGGVYVDHASPTYSPTDHKYLRIREVAGSVYWDASPDGTTWNNLTSWVSTLPLTHVLPLVGAGHWDVEPSPGTATFDNVNVAGVSLAQTVTDTASVSDALTAAQGWAQTLTDAAGATDTTSGTQSSAQTLTDVAGAADTVASATSRPVTDVAGTSDVLAQASTAAQTLTDVAGAADTVSDPLAIGVTVTDPAGTADALSQAGTFAPAITDPVGAADTVVSSGTGTVSILDVAGASDTLAQASTAAQTVTDPAGAADTAATAGSYARTISDAAGAVDSVASATVRELTDAAGAADSLTWVAPAVRAITDAAGAADTVQVSGAGIAQITDAAGTADSLTWSVPAARSITDPAEVGDSLATALTRTLTDAAGAADAVSRVQAFAATLTDAAGIVDSIASDGARTVTDPVGTADSIAAVQAFAVTITDAAGATDSISAAVIGIRPITDAAGVADSVSQVAATDAAQVITDPVGAADTVTRTLPTGRTLTDAADTSDTLSQTAPAVRGVSDTAEITDTVTPGVSVNRTITDVAGAADSTARDIGVAVTITDAAGVSDSATRVAVAQQVLADAAAIVDSVEPALLVLRVLLDAAGAADTLVAHAGVLDWVTAGTPEAGSGLTASRVLAGLLAERRETGLRATPT